MSKSVSPSQTDIKASAPAPASTSASSAWSRGPPPSSNPNSQAPSGAATPVNSSSSQGVSGTQQQTAQGNGLNGTTNSNSANGTSNGSAPMAIGGHSRKGSLMVGGGNGVDIKRGNLAFGTVDSPNPLLSSSPAAPHTIGAHLADTVKSFGSLDAESNTDSNAVKAARRQSAMAGQPINAAPVAGAPPKKIIDIHALFGAKNHNSINSNNSSSPNFNSNGTPSQAPSVASPPPTVPTPPNGPGGLNGSGGLNGAAPRRQSIGQQMNGYPGPNQFAMPGHNPLHRAPQQLPSPARPQSPVPQNIMMPPNGYGGGQMPQGFRPPPSMIGYPGMPQGQRPGPQGQQPMPRPGMMGGTMPPYGHPSSYMPGFPQGVYYPMGGFNGEQMPYNIPQQPWSPPSHPQNPSFSMPLSPRGSQSQLTPGQPSPSHSAGQLPPSGGPSPAPTPANRPQTLMPGHPSIPHQSISPAPPGTPQRNPMANAPVFTPGAPMGQGQGQGQGPQPPHFSMSSTAPTFTPSRPSFTPIRLQRADGAAVDIKQVAAAAKVISSAASGASTPDAPAADSVEPVKKKVPTLPFVGVRLESEQQKKARLEEEATLKRIKLVEEAEEKERQERKIRIAREAEEKKAKEEEEAKAAKEKEEADKVAAEAKAKEEAEEKKKAEEAAAAEAAKKATEQAEAETAAKAAADEAAAKAEAEAAAAPVDTAKDTPTSATPATLTPHDSPSSGSAGLPAKPLTGLSMTSTRKPANLEIKTVSSPVSEPGPSAINTAMRLARPIEDLSTIVYSPPIQTPNPEVNPVFEPTKFRYDRDFLMQFLTTCREKPVGFLDLAEVLLAGDQAGGFSSSKSQKGNPRGSVSGQPRGQTGLGIGNVNASGGRSFPSSMGTFGMGQFGSGGLGVRGTTSEDRYQKSLSAQSRPGSMVRTISSQGGGMPGMTSSMSGSRPGGPRGSNRGKPRQPQATFANPEPGVAPLVISANSWVQSRPKDSDARSPAVVERKVKSLLNKLTEENFGSIAKQILEWANKSADETDGMTLKLVIKLVFDKATDEAHWSGMYAKLCRKLLEELDPAITETVDGKPTSGGALFRKYLIGRCQADFESGWKAREDAATAAAAKSEEDKKNLAESSSKEGGEPAILSDEYYAAQKAKRRGLGLVQLIGELFKLEMLSKNVIRQCFIKLLSNLDDADEEDVESACKLLTSVGAQFEESNHDNVNTVFERFNHILGTPNLSSRMKFMIMDIKDLRKNNWVPKKGTGTVMTIAQIHAEAAKEQAAASVAARESMSRGGSRVGMSRGGGGHPGDWQSVNPSTARPMSSRPADFTRLGQNMNTSSAGPVFGGPQSTFRKNKAAGQNPTPPLSRQPSTNQFSLLDEAGELNPDAGPSSQAPTQRKRLALAPRTKPLPGSGDAEEGGDEGEEIPEGEEEQGDDDASTASHDSVQTPRDEAAEMTEEAAKAKIDFSMKELWGTKDAGGSRSPDDVVHYFRSLPEDRRPLLADRLLEDVFRLSKLQDAEVVAKGWSAATQEGAVTPEVLKKSLEARMPGLDDESVDFPQAYKAVALLFRALSLSNDDTDSLINQIDVFGEPRVTPKMKFDKAFGQLDEEAAKA